MLITHEMQIVKNIANRVAVMLNGRRLEKGHFRYLLESEKCFDTRLYFCCNRIVKPWWHPTIVKNLPDDSILAHLKYAGSIWSSSHHQ